MNNPSSPYQDAAILNIQRECQAAIDVGDYLIRRDKLGVPQSARNVFDLLMASGWIDASLAEAMGRMVGFRNVAIHDYQQRQFVITVNIIETHLDNFLRFSRVLLSKDAQHSRT